MLHKRICRKCDENGKLIHHNDEIHFLFKKVLASFMYMRYALDAPIGLGLLERKNGLLERAVRSPVDQMCRL